jgi:hypothetical protein
MKSDYVCLAKSCTFIDCTFENSSKQVHEQMK